MLKRIWALSAAVIVPFFIFVIVIGLNESDVERGLVKNSATNFDVEKKQHVKKPKPKNKRNVNLKRKIFRR